MHLHPGTLPDLVDETSGHRFGKVVTADEQMNGIASRGDGNGCLARRVAAPDDDHSTGAAHQSLVVSSGVVDAVAMEPRSSWYGQHAIPGSGRKDKGAATKAGVV